MNRQTHLWPDYSEEQRKAAYAEGEGLRAYLSAGKTERLCVEETLRTAQEAGFVDLYGGSVTRLKPGDRVYVNNHGKSLLLFSVGQKPVSEGMNIVGAHVDCPHVDLKLNPFYEAHGLTLGKTHYYGSIRKYQWISQPLSLIGVICKKDGGTVRVSVGEQPGEPAFCFTDLPPHLAKDQGAKPLRDAITGEDLNALMGALPADAPDEGGNKAEKAFVQHLHALFAERYGVSEDDFLSAELQLTPSGPARDAGLDASMVMGFGQDDKTSAYAAVRGMLRLPKQHARCAAVLLVDKEEIGSFGNTGMRSRFFENAVARIIALTGEDNRDGAFRAGMANSLMLSADVNIAYDPSHAEVSDERNAAYLGRGLAFNKYVGSAGKSGTSDANAEFVALLRRIFDEGDVAYHFAELGKVDQGGGGTISHIMAEYNMQVIDCGVPVLSVHAPWEISHKADVYESVKAYACFFEKAVP